MVTGGGGGDSGREKLGWGLGKVEEVLGKVVARGIEVWWPEEEDRRKEATAARADELRSSLVEVGMRKKEMTTGPHPAKYLGVTLADRPPIPSGPSAVFRFFVGVTFSVSSSSCLASSCRRHRVHEHRSYMPDVLNIRQSARSIPMTDNTLQENENSQSSKNKTQPKFIMVEV